MGAKEQQPYRCSLLRRTEYNFNFLSKRSASARSKTKLDGQFRQSNSRLLLGTQITAKSAPSNLPAVPAGGPPRNEVRGGSRSDKRLWIDATLIRKIAKSRRPGTSVGPVRKVRFARKKINDVGYQADPVIGEPASRIRWIGWRLDITAAFDQLRLFAKQAN
jgi:hypothetical protein